MKQVLLASTAAMVMAGTAFAAEPLYEPLPPAPPAVVEPFVVPTWAGPYVGADIGWGWADIDLGEDHFDDDFFDIGLLDEGDGELDGLVGGIFAGWLGQAGDFLYGVELFGQIAEIDRADKDDNGLFDDLFDDDDEFFVDNGNCFVDPDGIGVGGAAVAVDCPTFARNVQVHALLGLEGMIGWGGDRAALLLHAGPALGWFQRDDDVRIDSGDTTFDALFNGDDDNDDDKIELGVSVAAEGRLKLTERLFAGAIGRAFWFPDVGADDDNGLFSEHRDGDENNVTVFEVKARLGMSFGQPAAAAPSF